MAPQRLTHICAAVALLSIAPFVDTLYAQVVEQDSLALVDLYDQTNGDKWSLNIGWKTGSVPGWFGVTVENSRVTELALQVNNLDGVLPGTLSSLTELRVLALGVNQLRGEIPSGIGNLSALTTILLGDNLLEGQIPASLGNLSALEFLQLQRNSLSGTIPAEFGNLTKLQLLYLERNQLTGELPSTLGNLTELTELTLQSNLLSGAVPASFNNLKKLQTFAANRNQLLDLPDLTGMSGLTFASVRINRLTFEDIEPNIGLAGGNFLYETQDSVDTAVELGPFGETILSVDVGGANNQYQWCRTEFRFQACEPIAGATETSHLPSLPGYYWCEITNPTAPQLTLYSRLIRVESNFCPAKAGSGGCPIVVNDLGDAGFTSANPIPANNACDLDGGEPGLQCTLRAAIQVSNKVGGEQQVPIPMEIRFDLPTVGSVPPTISLEQPLPPITSPAVIDGTTQPEGLVLLDGSQTGDKAVGLFVDTDNSVIRGLNVQNFSATGVVLGGSENTVEQCILADNVGGIGTLFRASRNIVTDNVIVRNSFGAAILGDNNNVTQNSIGTNRDGTTAGGNTDNGLVIQCGSNNRVEGNTIAFSGVGVTNRNGPVELCGIKADGNIFVDNLIVSSARDGVDLQGSNAQLINNVISNNGGAGLRTSGPGHIIRDNRIGTDPDGTAAFPNGEEGVVSTCNDCRYITNTISGNGRDGLRIPSGHRILLVGNKIGTDVSGLSDLGNDGAGISVGGSERLRIAGRRAYTVTDINLTHNTVANAAGVGIELQNVRRATLESNYVGTDETGEINLSNATHGILVENSSDVTIDDSRIENNKADGVQLFESEIASLTRSTIRGSQTGVRLTKNVVGDYVVAGNVIGPNERNLETNGLKKPALRMLDNEIIEGQNANTGVHLTQSEALILGNQITGDAGDAIALAEGSSATIAKNNIFSNLGFGVNNLTPVLVTDARGNWWGHASGPGGVASGSGDAVSEGVDYTDWRTQPISVAAHAENDTIAVPTGEADTVSVYLRNWSVPDDRLNITLTEEQDWLTSPDNYSVDLDADFGAESRIGVFVAAGSMDGFANTVTVVARSQADPSDADTTTFVLIAAGAVLSDIFVSPDSVSVAPDDSVTFTALGVDQFGRDYDVMPVWTATGGSIDDRGTYVADGGEGTFIVTAGEPMSGAEGAAIVFVAVSVDVAKEPSVPTKLTLAGNYPNPFAASTTIPYSIPYATNARLVVYDVLGRQVAVLVNGDHAAGRYEVVFDAHRLPSGVYFARLHAGRHSDTRMIVSVR